MHNGIAAFLILILLTSCGNNAKPKPFGELRLTYPKPHYVLFNGNSPFSFEYSDFATITPAKNKDWYNLTYKKMNANVFITYFPIHNDLKNHIKDAERMVYEHTIKASAIDTKSFSYPKHRVYGNFYTLEGRSASNIQFFVTDSTKHFVTANLYFNTRPRPDSLAPAIEYVKRDLLEMISTFKWKN